MIFYVGLYEARSSIIDKAHVLAKESGSKLIITSDINSIGNQDVIYTDTWISMGMETEAKKREQDFAGFTVDQELMEAANSEAIFLHCLPAYRGFEVSAEVIDGPQSVIWQEAENRLHAQKALMAWLAEQN